MRNFAFVFAILFLCSLTVNAAEGSLSGSVVDDQGISLPQIEIRLLTAQGQSIKKTETSVTGSFQFFPIDSGDYVIVVQAHGFENFSAPVHVNPGSDSPMEIKLTPSQSQLTAKNDLLELRVAVRKKRQDPAPISSVEISKERVNELPQGEAISLPKLISTTSPGVVPGPFGQMFIRGNHANIQYQIDGVQLPDSSSNTFGEAFSPRNIDHMELITGGIPAQYGLRLAAVMNIVTKSGTETPGGSAEVNYGSYNTFSPIANFGGSMGEGNVHYYLSANYRRTDRGLDTPEPISSSNQSQGGTQAVHDQSQSNNEFAKFDWIADNSNKVSLVGFHSYSFFQIPAYPSTFGPDTPLFQQNFTDAFGNGQYVYIPYNQNDTQTERNGYLQTVWKHTFSEKSFLQLAPYWKYSSILVTNDPTNDLAGQAIPGQTPSSFTENRQVNNYGIKGDYTLRWNDRNLIKAGILGQFSKANGNFSVLVPNQPLYSQTTPDSGYFESIYLQDEFSISPSLILNAGLRFDATQFHFTGTNSSDSALQPRTGITWLATDSTKIHAYYGRLFQPAPVENLRAAFSAVGGGQASPYDIKAEKDNYYEVGVSQALPLQQTISVNTYYKDATNMLDDTQLLNTSIAQPYNFATGFAYGVEASIQGSITENLASYLNYSYEIAKGKGISGGIFAFNTTTLPPTTYQFLDHVQEHTLNAGATYHWRHFWTTGQALFGSGLRTGPANTVSLPSHLTFDFTLGCDFSNVGHSWWNRFKLSLDILNITNNVYPVTISNGYNGSHFAVGRQFYFHLIKEI